MTTPLHDFRVSRSASSSPARTAGRSSPTSGPTSSRWSSPVGRLDASVGCVWEGRSLSWSVIARGKRCVTGDLHYDGGRALSLDLVREAGIVVKNFRPGTMERLGLGYADLSAVNPGIVMVRSAGSVQDGPCLARRLQFDRRGDGRPALPVADPTGRRAASGCRSATSSQDCTPRSALCSRCAPASTGRGQVVDVSIFQSVLAMSGALVADFAVGGVTHEGTHARPGGCE